MSKHDAASVLADIVLLADFVLKIDHEKCNEAEKSISQEPSTAD